MLYTAPPALSPYFAPPEATGYALNSELVQRLVGITLLHTIDMGIDPSVIVAASGTSSSDMYWINQSHLVIFNLDTSASITDAWRLEPHKNGLVLTTTHHENSRRSVDVTIFCRANYNTRYMFISEKDEFYARQLYGSNIIEFPANQPKFYIFGKTYPISIDDIEQQKINGDQFIISIRISPRLEGIGGKKIGFDFDLARVYNSLLSVYVTLPEDDWLEAVSRNCI